jgi:hypothetical protein
MLKIINSRRPFLRRNHSHILSCGSGKATLHVKVGCRRFALGIHGVLQLG